MLLLGAEDTYALSCEDAFGYSKGSMGFHLDANSVIEKEEESKKQVTINKENSTWSGKHCVVVWQSSITVRLEQLKQSRVPEKMTSL